LNVLGEDVLNYRCRTDWNVWQHAIVASHSGARNVVITDMNPYRLELAKKLGTTRAVDVSKENFLPCDERTWI
jgi:Zn-dependent alcohol dehydrogenase